MKRPHTFNPSTVYHSICFSLLACFCAVANPNAGSGTAAGSKLRVNDRILAGQISAKGGALVADYGAFQVFRVSEVLAAEFATNAAVENVTEQNLIALNAGSLDTLSPGVMALSGSLAGKPGKELHLIQFAGPIKPEWRAALEDTGVQMITYIPHNAYLVYADASTLSMMQKWVGTVDYVQWEGAYLDDYKIHPAARTIDANGQPQTPSADVFAIQLVADSDANPATLDLIKQLKLEDIKQQEYVLNYLDVIVKVPAESLPTIAAQPEVISIQAYPEPEKRDERQDQIMAGNLTGTVPSAAGYLGWLGSKGFTQAQFTTSGFGIDVSDSGIDNGTTTPGHFGLYVSGNSSLASRVIYNRLVGTPNAGSTLQGCDGHGNLNTHIMAGYNNQPTGFPHTDSSGFHYGLGVCPFVKVGSSVVFDPDNFTSPSYENLQSMAYHDGARISGNSWGAKVSGAYNTDSQRYDALVRDAQPTGSTFATAGNQEMVIVFAAGNFGSAASSLESPGTAKNVFTIGATENVQSHSTAAGGNSASGLDGCGIDDSGADSANDVISFSSRGPCTDGRIKPDIMAPGTHITGGVGQTSPPPSPGGNGSAISCFNASGVCGLNGNKFFPVNQQFFTTSSGTSHSTPAVAGACALVRQYFINQGLTAPSPAMTKAFVMNSARYLTGVGASDTLPSNNQGMGEVNLGFAFDGGPRILRDELAGDKFTATGQTRSFTGTVANASAPFRVTLAWTDAPGNTTGNAYNNDLDLTVTAGGNTYKGNVFLGATSTTGGGADPRNNVESVFLPAGTSGKFVVTVTAANINSDGVPNVAPSLDQDFALVIYNGVLLSASFGAAPTNGAPTLSVIFNDTSTGTITSRHWDFGNGTTSNTTATTVTTTYNSPGSYNVSLTVYDAVGSDSLTRTSYINVTNPAPVIMANGFSLANETCPNGAIDAGETVTLNVTLKNIGGAATAQLVATLQSSGGIVGPSGPQTYGILSANGGTATMPFTFTAIGACGTTNMATFQLQDGAVNLGTVAVPLFLGNLTTVFSESFDTVTAPALPAGWTTATSGSQSNWITSAAQRDTVPNSIFATDASRAGVDEIVTPTINGATTLTFRHNFNTEAGFDGGVLEIKIGSGTFTDILVAGGTFITNGYNRTLSTQFSNPLAGRQAWSGTSNGFITTVVALPAAAATQAFQLKWRCGSDSSTGGAGWYIDTVSLTGLSCCAGPAILLKPRLAADGRLMFDLTGPSGHNYRIESSTDLIHWSTVTTVTNPTGQVTWTEPGPAGSPVKSYRAIRLP